MPPATFSHYGGNCYLEISNNPGCFKALTRFRNRELQFYKTVLGDDKVSKVPAIAEATAKAGVWVIPNLTAYKGIWLQAKDIAPVLERPEVQYVPKSITEDWQPER